MEITIRVGNKRYVATMDKPHDLSIPVCFDGASLSAFGARPAHREAYATDGFTGDVSKGGSCNCDMLSFSPHLHGTHTECVGHITKAPIAVCDILKDSLIPATLITVSPKEGKHDGDTYIPELRADDAVITKHRISEALSACKHDFLEALIIRTLPNEADKRTRNYTGQRPPFFSCEAMNHIVSCGVKHLLVDIPSVDRLDDEGRLTNHHLFWDVEQGSHETAKPSSNTITELVYVPDDIASGTYLLNLQVAAFASDAAPSRPLLYGVRTA